MTDLQRIGHPTALVLLRVRADGARMRMRGRDDQARLDATTDAVPRRATWDGIDDEVGPAAVIRAQRAGDLAQLSEHRQVA